MFVKAVSQASHFTFPYVGLRQRADGGVHTIVASFVVVNAEGWIVTSAHIIEELLAAQRALETTDGDAANTQKEPHRIVRRSEIWALPGFASTTPHLVGGRVNPTADLATGRLEPFDAALITKYPVFRDTAAAPVQQGESVCRFGFPFHSIKAGYDEERHEFDVGPGSFPVPSFALDGIVARFNRRGGKGGSSALFVETSSAGLRGQSGGPLLDAAGRVCGIQSMTAHLDLGFDAPYADADGERVTERQFLNVGLASHVDEVNSLLDAEGVSYRTG